MTEEKDELVIDLSLMKFWHFYQIFDPNSPKLFNRSLYQLIGVVVITVYLSVFLYGHFGIFSNTDDVFNDIDIIKCLIGYFSLHFALINMVLFLHRRNTIWNLFDLIRSDFLTSKICHKYRNMLYDCREWTKKATIRLMVLELVITTPWLIRPLVLNAFDDHSSPIHRKENIGNLRFPVSVNTFNKYYVFFYLMELLLTLCLQYTLITVNMFIVTFCSIISVKQKILANSFAEVGYENKSRSEHYEDFKSILSDHRQLSLKFKSFYFVIRPIMIIYFGIISSIIIFLTYTCVVMILSAGSHSVYAIINFLSTAIAFSLQLFVFAYLLDIINTNRESVNFGIYSSNWTAMDLKFKKLLLLAMRLNDSNQITYTLKATPKKIFNLQLFANVMITCYNIISVMIKTIHTKQQYSEYL